MQYHSRALRHHREAPALEQDGRAEAALELEELADRGDRDPPLLDPDGAPSRTTSRSTSLAPGTAGSRGPARRR